MDNRRDFLKKAALLSGAAGLSGALPSSIQKAFAIDPDPGTTWLDAEHVVVLMQENRSFDHTFGTLRGVRGFNDPRAISLPNKNRVWLQTDEKNNTYIPFRYNLKDTKITWMSSLPHRWEDQSDARNHGRYDKWLEIKKSGNPEYRSMPLALGYYNREDIPFYYALADAFTVCDHNFCSSLTGTTPNRLYHWTGTVREKPDIQSKANVRNSDVDYWRWASWTTFPERLEDNGIPWKIYQNELSLDKGLPFDEQEWLCNFTDNPIEWFEQFNVRYSPGYYAWLQDQKEKLPPIIAEIKKKLETFSGTEDKKRELMESLADAGELLPNVIADLKNWPPEGYENLSPRSKSLHEKAFTINSKDPHFHELMTHTYMDGADERSVRIPKGDILHQFREDVNNGQLPAVSWIVASARFSDHPGGPWYGVWYLSEVIDILTKNPEVWKKTVFILNYDENDGYFDHVPPFVAPNPHFPNSGKASAHIDTHVEHVAAWQEMEHQKQQPGQKGRTGPIGLGYRVPMIVASPWSRGGAVCSQVFDHTSVLQLLEKFCTHKFGKKIEETNISAWRRAVCGDLSACFKPYHGEALPTLQPVGREAHMELITNARFRPPIPTFVPLSPDEIAAVNKDPRAFPLMPQQEKGIRPSRPLPYQLYTGGTLSKDKKSFAISFHASKEVFRDTAAGCPFIVYATGAWKDGPWHPGLPGEAEAMHWSPVREMRVWNYTVAAGDTLTDNWSLADFDEAAYRLEVYGPNGYYRVFGGNAADPGLEIACKYQRSRLLKKQLTGNIQLEIANHSKDQHALTITDNAYGGAAIQKTLNKSGTPGAEGIVLIDCSKSFGWYDLTVRVTGNSVFERRFAGHVETGKESFSDPLMGQMA